MGQYHVLVNLSKREFVHPYSLGDLFKLREMANTPAGMGVAMMILLTCSSGRGGGDFPGDSVVGRWAGDRVALVGDYAEDDDLPAEFEASVIFGLCRREGEEDDDEIILAPASSYADISDLVKPVIEAVCDMKFEPGKTPGVVAKRDLSTGKLISPALCPDFIIGTGTDYTIGKDGFTIRQSPLIKGGIEDESESSHEGDSVG